MNAFPDKLRPENKNRFKDYQFNRKLCKLRQRIVDYMYSGDTKGFDLKQTQDNGVYNYTSIDQSLVDAACKELESLGWNTKLAYGNTTLFIFSDKSELPPMSEMEEID